MPEPIRKWLFRIEDFEGDKYYLDENGTEGSYDDLPLFVGTYLDASIEGDRRADLWENENGLVARLVLESQGIWRVK